MSRSVRVKTSKPSDPRVLRLEVLRSERVSPSFQRVTVGGDGLRHFAPMGYDQWFRMFLPRAGQADYRLPTRTSALWYAQWLATPSDKRPDCRNYTVRAIRPEAGELDIDFVLHTPPGEWHVTGVAASWALAAQPGAPLGLLDQGTMYSPHASADGSMIVADETGLPAVEGILRTLPRDTGGDAVVEIPDAADRRDLGEPTGFTVHWVVRADHHDPGATPGAATLEYIRGLPIPSPQRYVFAIGESSLVTGVRRHLVAAHVPKEHIHFSGYWRAGH
ncbi:siderophore-interacting protein [Luethyella okanaganae]|uniref:Siderophore-interacting protein n=1 Tax=Luethyella okanaganae TaxID=69372 RepID=A0ABW1VDJ2_9MICO